MPTFSITHKGSRDYPQSPYRIKSKDLETAIYLCQEFHGDDLISVEEERPKAIIYDLDGVVANSQERYRLSGGDECLARGDYNGFCICMRDYNKDTQGDLRIDHGIELIDLMRKNYDVDRMVALTARGNDGRVPTMAWLCEHMPWGCCDNDLVMRPEKTAYEPGVYWKPDEPRFDAVEFKRGVALDLMKTHDIVAAFDDHVDISQMYWSIGILSICLMVPGVDQGSRVQAALAQTKLVQG